MYNSCRDNLITPLFYPTFSSLTCTLNRCSYFMSHCHIPHYPVSNLTWQPYLTLPGVVEPVYSKFSENGSVSTSGHTTEGSVSSSLSPSRASTFKVRYDTTYCITFDLLLSYSNSKVDMILSLLYTISFLLDLRINAILMK